MPVLNERDSLTIIWQDKTAVITNTVVKSICLGVQLGHWTI